MPIYKLTPIDLETHNWNASRYKGEAVIRAGSAEGARSIAQLAFLAAYDFNEVGRMAISPWVTPDEVSIEEIIDHEFPTNGPDAVLLPEGYGPL